MDGRTYPDLVSVPLRLNGADVEVPETAGSLLEALRDHLGDRSPKDGCSPQGQCGCCTVLVDGAPRVACVTPVRRVAGREITTLAGLEQADEWADAFCATGASQCGFCTPGIILRLEGARRKGADLADEAEVDKALAAHLCRCTGWRTIVEAARSVGVAGGDREGAAERAALEGGVPQDVGPQVALGAGGFADDLAPADALVAVPDGQGGYAVADTLAEARRVAGKVQGRRTTVDPTPPLALPDGDWDLTLRTTWVEPAYLEPDASWCEPGGQPAGALGNGGAFGGKVDSPVRADARRLADEHGRVVRVLWSREDTVRLGPKRPPIAAGVKRDGTGVVRVVRTAGIAERLGSWSVEEVDVAGPPTSTALRAAGWAEAAMLAAGLRGEVGWVEGPDGGRATAAIADGRVQVRVDAGRPLDDVVLRSYAIGAAHMALSWVCSEHLAVDDGGEVHDLTIRSFGILKAGEMPEVDVAIEPSDGPPVNGSDAVFAAVAAAAWLDQGCPPELPTGHRYR
jgi:aerobic-type carbon monoxide dehydrogenase small subunit (CoxS/CutS family)